MTTTFRRIYDASVMCTWPGCAEVAAFYLHYWDSFRGKSVEAYCQAHAADAAKRLSYPWPIPEGNGPEEMRRPPAAASRTAGILKARRASLQEVNGQATLRRM
jgi:hypothetical protein